MILFQEFEESSDKLNFILESISSFQSSDFFQKAIQTKEYYRGENRKILNRLQWFYNSQGLRQEDNFKANNQIPNELFPMLIKQGVQYLLSNGVKMPVEYKDRLKENFEVILQKIATDAVLTGQSWGLITIDKDNLMQLTHFESTSFIPFIDELSGAIRGGVRYYQARNDRPLYVELYEEDGVTIYQKKEQGSLVEFKPKRAYNITINSSIVGDEVIGVDNWSQLPIIQFKGNDDCTTSLTPSRKNIIDLIDIVVSDFGNNLEDAQDVYWILKNYNGDDLEEFLHDYKKYKTIQVGDDGDAKQETTDIPHDARKEILSILQKLLIDGMMGLDIREIKGGSITNEVIKAMYSNLDLKTDELEFNATDFMTQVLGLYKEYYKVKDKIPFGFIRNRVINISQTIEDIYTFRSDIDHQTALELNPMINEEDIDIIIQRMEEESMKNVELNPMEGIEGEELTEGKPTENNSDASEGVEGEEVEKAEEVAGKSLNGSQTKSLLIVIEQYSQGLISEGQAINILSVSLGIDKKKAKEILKGV